MPTAYPDIRQSAFSDLKESTRKLAAEEPSEIRQMRIGTLSEAPGSYDQYFTTWDFANGMVATIR
ncbi:hypothetical protein DMC63_15665 [Streptomyces sp. WAC 05977]|nr:hypothetical protein DMC63_15665 [Streptomyces sp. WAC 05977]